MPSILNISRVCAPLALGITLSACSEGTDFDFEQSIVDAQAAAAARSAPEALFNPGAAQVPFPSNLLFAGSADGTLNIPISEGDDSSLANPQVALSQMDGFSTTSPITTPVSEELDQSSLVLGDTVRVFEVTTPPGTDAASSVQRSVVAALDPANEITDPTELSVFYADNQLLLIPVKPLAAATSYMVVLTSGITDVDGNSMSPSFVYRLLRGDESITLPGFEALEGLRQTVGTHLAALAGPIPDTSSVVLTWVFTTQTTTPVLQAVKDASTATSLQFVATGQTVDSRDPEPIPQANIFAGVLELPYYQTAVVPGADPSPALNGFWQTDDCDENGENCTVPGAFTDGIVDNLPVASTVSVPVLLTVPVENTGAVGTMPAAGWPVTIFQHGITGNRTNMLAIAQAMANQGRAVVAIDMPVHGLNATEDFYVSAQDEDNLFFNLGATERTFDIDVVTIDPDTFAISLGPDGFPDPSGQHFYNLQNLANSRDNLRQAIADLFVLSETVGSAQFLSDATTGAATMLDASDKTFVGHSLGGIVGTTMLAFDNTFSAATLAMPGGGIAQLLANSQNFGPVITGALASAGIDSDSAAFQQFLVAAQTMIDSADPINHAATAGASATPIHFIEVIGDATVPNNVPTAPLSGTDPLICQLGLTTVNVSNQGSAAVRFDAEGANHGSILIGTDAASLAVTAQMQSQMASFAQSGMFGNLVISDATLLQDPTEAAICP